MVVIYGVLRSRVTRPVWLMRELGQPFELVPVMQAYRLEHPQAADAPFNTASPDFLTLNPAGQIPVMVDGDLVLTESMAIPFYLAKKFGGPLAPASAEEEAEALQWAFAAITGIEGPALDMLQVIQFKRTDTEEGQAVLAKAQQQLARPLSRLEGHLAEHDFLVGDRFTVADILMAECVRYVQAHAPAMEPYPAIRTWLGRCQSRPAFRDMMEERAAEPL
ncbi:glutathione S-transferase family protein [Pararhodobacter sp. CCB-MM2]|uniref:glutathione S-transferase family protein n=1 Tax=Pararhodobacter sp. CCB-MM2 TaxID=1786003 RepID=UPI00082DD543|nr:glutathione S-transferase family protein [Pararhodobacter sp. CCB-MM2]